MRIACCAVLLLILCGLGSGNSQVRSQRFPVSSGHLYQVTVWAAPDGMAQRQVRVKISDGRGLLAEKPLHAFDPDFHHVFRARVDGDLTVDLTGQGVDPNDAEIRVEITPVKVPGMSAVIAAGGNATWREAQEFNLGQTVFGSGDDRPYVPVSSDISYQALMAGVQWFRFTSNEKTPKLVYLSLDSADRDVPSDVDVFRRDHDELTPYRDGASPYTPEATQNFPGLMKFRTCIVKPGETYYVRVAANHPSWQLRTERYDVPPYRNAQQAVQAGMNYLIRLGDAWHANTPRRGSVALRSTMPHAETSSCIACHATQFTARGYLTAVKNGYQPMERPAIDFVLDRLRNNPRPLYGQEGTDWARVIFSARTVASRVPVLLDMQAEFLGGRPASDVTRGYANYLNLHWSGRDTMAAEEADGSQPAVSPFEIGLQSWKTYGLAARDFAGEPQWAERRSSVERMMVAAKTANVIDLGWKIAGLATIGRTRYRTEIQALVAELYRWQREDGRFPYAFDANAPASDFITYQALYALAVAGQRPETDAKLATIIAYTLHAQRPEGGWQGNAVYKGFDTPFRDTQFAVMALSELFPSHDANLVPKTDLELLGEKRSAAVVLLQSESVLAREAAARECRDSGALAKALGDRSKLVQRAAAESLRKLGQAAAADIASALQSTDSRTRWGALRVFDKHFRELSGDEKLLTAVVSQLSDSAPENRFAAAKALWQWYSWQSDSPERRMKILNALAGRTGAEPNALVRRGLSESIYNVLDENIGQLAAWQRAMADDKDRGRTQQALQAVVREQSAIMARHIREGNRDARITLLTALWDFHVRHMAIPDESRGKVDVILPAFFSQYASGVAGLGDKGFEYAPYREAASFRYDARNGFQQVRLGNDGDLIRLFADSGTELEQALLACLQPGDREMTLQVIKAGSVLGDAVTPNFTGAMLGLLHGEDAEIRTAVRYVYEKNARGRLSLGEQKHLAPLLEKLLVPERPDALAVALPLLAELPLTHPLVHDWKIIARVEALAVKSSLPQYAEVLRAMAAIPRLADGPLMRAQLLEALQSGDEQAGVVAMRLVVGRYVTDATVSALAEQFLHATRGRLQAMLLDELDPGKYALRVTAANSYNGGGALGKLPVDNNLFSSPQVVEFVSQSLTSPTPLVREAARDLVREHPDLAVKAGLRVDETRPQPDFEYFAKRVEPILSRVASDGKACAMCHASHALFKLTPGRTRDNYLNALKVVDQADPRKSLILVKPTRPNDSAGDPNLYLATHNGGERWAGNEISAEYQTVLEWIRGARLAPVVDPVRAAR